ncbi:HAMP domain-containing histidine kinase [Natronomonas salsuginis]|uniref:HAMP domain-containing histidine kinase n=1 Tax=Natronomonas salsuginis TaxID=2217661 RepID=A0A4U5JDV1_9EURY|nr:HAMP domain-containing histidine kinase [Natronomonas salsuginis]TKR27550.1 HAMP domain-containing histidine kinase [Natronomonas salsuginis]
MVIGFPEGARIPESKRKSVFESGYSTDVDGTGFGLSIAREAADAHG